MGKLEEIEGKGWGSGVDSGNSPAEKVLICFLNFILILLTTLSLRLNVSFYIIVYSEISIIFIDNFSVIMLGSYWEAKFLYSGFTFGPKTGFRET